MLQVRSIAMAVWRASTATVTTAGASMGMVYQDTSMGSVDTKTWVTNNHSVDTHHSGTSKLITVLITEGLLILRQCG